MPLASIVPRHSRFFIVAVSAWGWGNYATNFRGDQVQYSIHILCMLHWASVTQLISTVHSAVLCMHVQLYICVYTCTCYMLHVHVSCSWFACTCTRACLSFYSLSLYVWPETKLQAELTARKKLVNICTPFVQAIWESAVCDREIIWLVHDVYMSLAWLARLDPWIRSFLSYLQLQLAPCMTTHATSMYTLHNIIVCHIITLYNCYAFGVHS